MPKTDDQRNALWDITGLPIRGLRVLSARPGTGKTSTLSDYCIDIAARWSDTHKPWQGMAMVSYTNVAKSELEQKLRQLGRANILLSAPNFVGTLDAFVNQQLFLPHGAEIMQCTTGRPTLVGEPYQQWKTPWSLDKARPANAFSIMYFDCYTISCADLPLLIDKEPRQVGVQKISAKPVTLSNSSKILSMKKYVWRQGMALQSDATYIAYQALKASPSLTRALVNRFPTLVIDEAQDMTETQHALIDHLVTAGHQHVILVGDENQAIYEWNTARPQLFIAKGASETWQAKSLSQSFRCSPAICASLTTMADDGIILTAAPGAKNASYKESIEIIAYDPGYETRETYDAVTSAAQALSSRPPHDGNPDGLKSLAVLARSSQDARQLQAEFNGIKISGTERPIWNSTLTRDYLKVIYLLNCGNLYAAAGSYESLLLHAGNYDSIDEMRIAVAAQRGIAATDTVGYRVALFEDLTRISSDVSATADPKISECSTHCDAILAFMNSSQRMEVRNDCNSFMYSGKRDQDRQLSALFVERDARTWLPHPDFPSVRLLFSTAHGVKGETYDGVVFYAKKRTSSCGCPNSAALWQKILTHSMLDCETKRIAYVALSRAAQVLKLVVPADDVKQWLTHTSG